MPTKIKHILTPRLTPPILANKGTEYKMCKQINKSDFCSYGNKCKFAHSSELLLWRALQQKGFFDNEKERDQLIKNSVISIKVKKTNMKRGFLLKKI